MSQLPQAPGPGSLEVFVRPQGSRKRAYLCFAGAGGLVLVAIGGFFAALRSRPDMIAFQGMTTVPLLVATGLIFSAIRSLRAPCEVRVGDTGMQIVDSKGSVREWSWDQITFVDTRTQAMSAVPLLAVHGIDGRAMAGLPHDFERFDVMVASIKRRLAEHPAPARDTAQAKKARRTGALLVGGAVLAWLLGGVNVWMALSDREAQRLMKERGAPAVATVVKRIAPDGRTHRIEYRVDDAGGRTGTANVEINPFMWQMVHVGMRVNVVAVPGRPDISRLAAGQIDDNMKSSPETSLLVSAAILVMGCVFFVVGLLSWRGVNVKLDAKGGLRVERVGRGTEPPSPAATGGDIERKS